jgi:predicted dithiol-disulfide oxidoreductase (DUF899 family)
MQAPKIVTRQEWLEARRALLAKEKELTRARDDVARQRRELPWVRIEKRYEFDGPSGKRSSLGDLFAGRSQLLVYHFMLGPGWKEGCPSCSFWADGYDGMVAHLAHRDVSFVVVSRAPLAEIEAYRKRMGWRFPWVSSFGSDFNYDFHVSFTPEEMAKGEMEYNFAKTKFPSEEGPGISVFYRRPDGAVFHTYSCYARGLDPMNSAYQHLDLVPKGRDEDGLPYPMAWVRRHDSYGD